MKKPKYKIRWHSHLWFDYYDAATGKKLGKWDVFAITKKGKSRLPYQFYNEIVETQEHWRKRYDRRVKALRMAACEAGISCGFDVHVDSKKLVVWTVTDRKKKVKPVVAIAVLHYRWRNESLRRTMTKELLNSESYLRYVVDTCGRVTVTAMPKREL